MKIETFKKIKMPNKPGVYFFRREKEIIYIGKATSLRDRVKSYFGKDLIEARGPVILDMVFKADKITWQETDSVLEALILEAELIKKYQPKYNTKEKSDKSFNYVVITKEELPRVIVVRGKDLGNSASLNFSSLRPSSAKRDPRELKIQRSSVFGPYTNSSQLKEALKIIRRIFPFLDDKSKNYAEFYRQINLVPDLANRKMYLQNIKNMKLFFQGKKKIILKNLEKEMKVYAGRREFENAGEIKRQIFALKHINDVALLKLEPSAYGLVPTFRIEAYDIAHMGGKNMVGVMVVVENGVVNKSEYKKFKIRTQKGANDTGALVEVLERRLAHPEWVYPDLIVVDGSTAQINFAKSALMKVDARIPVVSVVKDERHKPKGIIGESKLIKQYKNLILLANNEAHRFAINYHKNLRAKSFLAPRNSKG